MDTPPLLYSDEEVSTDFDDFEFELNLDDTSLPSRCGSADDFSLVGSDGEGDEDGVLPMSDEEINAEGDSEEDGDSSQNIIEGLRGLAKDLLEQLEDRIATLDEHECSSGSESDSTSTRRKRTKYSRQKRIQSLVLELKRRQAERSIDASTRKLLFPRGRAGSAAQYGARELAVVLRVACLLVEGLLVGAKMTKRDLYYKDVRLFKTQAVVDAVVDDLATNLGVRRIDLGIVAASKGLFGGPLQLHLANGQSINGDESSQGTLIPCGDDIEDVYIADVVKYILVAEKEAVFRTLAAAEMDDVILISGKGYPDIATSELVKCLVDTHGDSLICAALVDGDPHGLDILSVYRHGSSNRAFDRARLAAPNLGWLGVRSEDLRDCDVQDSALLPLTSRDRKKALSMLARRPPLPDDVRTELLHMLHRSRKAEIEALPNVVQYVRNRIQSLFEDANAIADDLLL